MSESTPTMIAQFTSLEQFVRRIADFSDLVSLSRTWEISRVVGDPEGDPTAITRLTERLREMLPPDFNLSEDGESLRVLEEAIVAAYHHSAIVNGGFARLLLTEPTLFGQVVIEGDVDAAEAPFDVIVRAADGAELERVVVRSGDLNYQKLRRLLEDVVEELSSSGP